MKNQAALRKATKEATTGRFADVGLELGALAGRDVALRAELSRHRQARGYQRARLRPPGRDAAADQRCSSTPRGLSEGPDRRPQFRQRRAASSCQPACANLQSLIGALNVTYGRLSICSRGINTAEAPITDYAAGLGQQERRRRGVPRDVRVLADLAAGVEHHRRRTCRLSSIPTFDAEFADPAWGTNWSTASDQVMRSRISTTQTIDTSVSANEPASGSSPMAYTMMSDLGNANLNQAAFQAVVDKAHRLVIGDAINDLAVLGGRSAPRSS